MEHLNSLSASFLSEKTNLDLVAEFRQRQPGDRWVGGCVQWNFIVFAIAQNDPGGA